MTLNVTFTLISCFVLHDTSLSFCKISKFYLSTAIIWKLCLRHRSEMNGHTDE